MKLEYTEVVQELSFTLFQALWERETDLEQKVPESDSIVNKLLRRIGFLVVLRLKREHKSFLSPI